MNKWCIYVPEGIRHLVKRESDHLAMCQMNIGAAYATGKQKVIDRQMKACSVAWDDLEKAIERHTK